VFLPRQRYDSCRLHLIVEYRPISAMLRFEYPLDLQMVTVAQGRRFSSANNDAAATRGTSQQEDHVFAAINGSAFPQPGRYTLQSNALMIEARRMGRDITDVVLCRINDADLRKQRNKRCADQRSNAAASEPRCNPLHRRWDQRWAPY
ncbi:MAG: hypothetical protein WB677_05335, partial [Xanthobacteraceae bacterium]